MSDIDDPGRPAGIVHDYADLAQRADKFRREREGAIAGRPAEPDMRDLIKPTPEPAAPAQAPLPAETIGNWWDYYKGGKKT